VIVYLWVALGSALGGVARMALSVAMVAVTGLRFPWGTLLINVVGSFVIGWFGALSAPDGRLPSSPDLRAFVLVGLCGGFTTFSSFSLQTLQLFQAGEVMLAGAYILGSVTLCLLAVWAGVALGG
jgi:CrcB protein